MLYFNVILHKCHQKIDKMSHVDIHSDHETVAKFRRVSFSGEKGRI